MINIFQIYVAGNFHLISLVFAVASVLVNMFLLRGSKFIYGFMNAMVLSVLSHFLYEDFFTFYYRLSGFGVDSMTPLGVKLYLSVTLGIALLAYILNVWHGFLKLDKFNLLTCLLIFIALNVALGSMFLLGWFEQLYLWFNGGLDPHNWLWALSKLFGLTLLTPLLVDLND